MDFNNLIEKSKLKGIESLEVYFQKTRGMAIDLFNDDIDQYQINETMGMSVRGIVNGKMAYVGLEKVEDSLSDFILDKLVENAKLIEKNDKLVIFEGDKNYSVDTKIYTDFSSIDPTVKIELLKDLKNIAFSLDSRVKSVLGSYSEKFVNVNLVNSYNLDLNRKYSYAILFLRIVMEENGESKSGYDYIILNDLNFDKNEFVEKVVTDLKLSLNPKKVKSGVYNVVIKNEVMQDLISCFLSSFSGSSAKNKTTALLEKLDTKIGNELINFNDTPLDSKAHFNTTFDDEGVSTYKKSIVEKGVFKMFMHNLETATHFKTKSTGNGFKYGLMGKVSVSHTNFSLEPKEDSFEQLIEKAENGIYLTSAAGMHSGVNPINGDFSLQGSGFVIENGKISYPITLFVVSGNFFEVLNNIQYIGNDFKYNTSSIGSSSVLVKLDIAGENN